MKPVESLVVGAGAAGMMASIHAAEAAPGSRVVLLEGNDEPGRKVLVSGNGRCNLANVEGDDPEHYHGRNPRFVQPALAAFSVTDTLDFFHDLGLLTHEEKRGRLFPLSDQARSVTRLLADRMATAGVEVHTGTHVSQLQTCDGGFRVATATGTTWEAATVVMCSGGVSLPRLGADDSGMRLVEGLGHTRTELWPGLVALESDDPWIRRAQGVKVRARVRAQAGRATVVDTDDLLFAKYGVSGFTILNLSARLVPHLQMHGPLSIIVSLLPEHTPEQASELLKVRWDRHPHRGLALSLAGLLHDKLARALLDKAGLDPETPVGAVGRKPRWDLARLLTGWPIQVTRPRDFDYAEVTIGGVRTGEVDPYTMQSYVAPGLYLAGEILDVHADLGGFNLQWAWSSGRLAGLQAAAR